DPAVSPRAEGMKVGDDIEQLRFAVSPRARRGSDCRGDVEGRATAVRKTRRRGRAPGRADTRARRLAPNRERPHGRNRCSFVGVPASAWRPSQCDVSPHVLERRELVAGSARPWVELVAGEHALGNALDVFGWLEPTRNDSALRGPASWRPRFPKARCSTFALLRARVASRLDGS